MLCHGQVAFAEERGNDLYATTSSSEDTFYEIYSLDVANTTKLVQDVNNRISYYNTFSGYYLLQFATANVPITMNVNILEDGMDYDDQFEIVSLPSFTDIEGNVNAFKFYMSADKYYDIDVMFSNVYVGEDNSIDAIVTLSSWKAFKSIKINDTVIHEEGETVNGTHIYFGEKYDLTFDYVGGLSPDSMSTDKWQASAGMGDLVTLTSNSFTVKKDLTKEGKILTLEFLDHENKYTISFVVRKPYYAELMFDSVTYETSLLFKDSYGNIVNSSNANYNKTQITFGEEITPEIYSTSYDISKLPVLTSNAELSAKVWFNGTMSYTQETGKITVNNPRLNLSTFTGAGTNQRIIFYGNTSNKVITITDDVKVILFDCIGTFTNAQIKINTNHDIDIFIYGISFTTTDKQILFSNAPKTTIHMENTNSITGKTNQYLIDAKNIVFIGSGSIQIIGGNGANGRDGTSSSINGSNGENGTNALKCTSYSVLSGNVTIKGGDGGNGGNGYNQTGANGLNGGKGGNGGDAGYGIKTDSESSNNGYAGRGGDGGKGGNGGNGSDAYITAWPYGYNGFSHHQYGAGLGLRGGDGGTAVRNGAGNTINPKYSNPRGGDGGNGGKGGNGYLEKVMENGDTPPPSIVIPYSTTYKLPPANGGNGGNGGFSDHGDGGNGGNGGRGGSGYNGIDNDGSNWQGGSGASGGSGGSGGGSTNGNRGKNGSNGSTGYSGNDGTEPSCVTEGTLITLADGTQKAVEDLTGSEQLLVWNLFTGKFDTAPILFVDHDEASEYEVINLTFSDGTMVKVISEHGFWDFDLNEYVFLRSDAAKYIGHWFNKKTTAVDGSFAYTRVQLIGVTVQKEVTTAWSPVTYGHLCYYVNGMLSMPGATTGLINIFNVDTDTMKIDETKYNEDIAEYGLFTYEEFSAIYPVSEVIFEAFGGKYLKVSIGKGLITIDELNYLIHRYAEFFAMN